MNKNAKNNIADQKKWICNDNNENCAMYGSNDLNDNKEKKNVINKKKDKKSKRSTKDEKQKDLNPPLNAHTSFTSSDYLFTDYNVAHDGK